MNLHVRPTFGHDARSMRAVMTSLGIHPPASIKQLAQLYVQDRVFDEPIVTSGGVALGGHHTLTVRRDGSYRYQGHFRATGFPSYEVAILTTLGYSIPVPGGGPPAGAMIAFTAQGRVHGSNEPGRREYSWDKSGQSPLLASEWSGVRRAILNRQVEYDVDWFGPVGDVASLVGQIVVLGTTFGSAGVAVVIAGEAIDHLNLEQLVLPGTVGVLLAGGAGFVLGPSFMIPAFLVGAVVTAALVKQRHLEHHERVFADKVFQGRVPYDRVLLTNLVGLGDRPFTAPAPGGAILVNLGKGFDNPVSYTGKGGDRLGINAPGQLLIHELTHAWQIANESFTPAYYCRAVSTASSTAGGDMSAYDYGPPSDPWSSFGTEQQGSIVDEWFAGSSSPDSGRQSGYPAMSEDDWSPNQNPYYRYIRDNIRTGIA